MHKLIAVLCFLCFVCVCVDAQQKRELPLPSSKVLLTPAPGAPQRTNSLPVTIAVSPDQKYIAILNNGYGRAESNGQQSIAVLSVATNELTDFPDVRLGRNAKQTFFLGLAFSRDGKHLYASIGSITDPEGKEKGSLGNGIAVYAFANGRVVPERFIPIPLQTLAKGKKSIKTWSKLPDDKAVPFPAGIAVVNVQAGEQLLVAGNLSDDALLIDGTTGKIIHRFDLSTSEHVPAAYPYAVAADPRGHTAWVSLWNSSRIAELNLVTGKVARCVSLRAPKTASDAGSHASALKLSRAGDVVYVTLANSDEIAAVNTVGSAPPRYFSTKLPGQKFLGAYPNAITLSPDGRLLFVATASSDAVAVYETKIAHEGTVCLDDCDPDDYAHFRAAKLLGFIPTEWYPTALAVVGNELFIASGKGQSTGPNNRKPKLGEDQNRAHPFIAALLHGSIARVKLDDIDTKEKLKPLTDEVLRSNLMLGKGEKIPFASGKNPIKHIIYIIKENRSYDQVFGDLKPGDGDPSLVMYGEDITPNQHKLARQFGIIDNFYDSGEVSGDGHVWSTAAITSDYTEKTWQINYRGRERTYDYEGHVANGVPLEEGIPDVNEPGTGYLWTSLARHKKTYRHYGEYVTTRWCNTVVREAQSPIAGTPLVTGYQCERTFTKTGEPLPDGNPSRYKWPIPIVALNQPTKPELRGHFDPRYADFRMDYPDQLRADEFLREFSEFVKDGSLPQFITIRLPNDHTAGTSRNNPTPAAAVADNDLALGRIVEAVSHSKYWDSTGIFVLEDDAQNGADHVDAHRSLALVISKYAPCTVGSGGCATRAADKAFVDHHFYTTVNMIHTMEALLGLPPMNNNDARAALMAPLFSGDGTQPAFTADYRNRDNGLIYTANPEKPASAPQAADMRKSESLDFSRADAADAVVLNEILWRERRGDAPMPVPLHTACGNQ